MKLRNNKIISQDSSKNQDNSLTIEIIKQYLSKVNNAEKSIDKIKLTLDLFNFLINNLDFVYSDKNFHIVTIKKIMELYQDKKFKRYILVNNIDIGKYFTLLSKIKFNHYIKSKFFECYTNFNINTLFDIFNINCIDKSIDLIVNTINTHTKNINSINSRIKFKNQTLYSLCYDKVYKSFNLDTIKNANLTYFIKNELINEYSYINSIKNKVYKTTRSGKIYNSYSC
jgi:hypothetical protein